MNPFEPGTDEHAAWERQTGTEGAAALDQTAAWIRRYLSVPSEHFITVMTLWAAHTHVSEVFYVTPRLVIDSAEPESGKTRVLELLNLLTRAPIFTMNTTIAALYRRLSGEPRTILLDETDAIFAKGAAQNHEDLRALLNAGYKRGATVDRCVPKGNEIEVVAFPVFAPAALAGIAGNMPPTITTRSVTLHMRRRAPGEHVDDFIEEDATEEAAPLREALSGWLASVAAERIKGARPAMPDGVRDRKAEVWRALLAVADAAGGTWPTAAREACRYFVLDTDPGELSLGVRLLADLRQVFGDRDRVPTAEIIERLRNLDEAPWADMWGKPIDARRLSKMLSNYGAKPKVIKTGQGTTTARGYVAEDLTDLWRRYLPEKRNQRNPRNSAGQTVTDGDPVTDPSVTGAGSETTLTSQVTAVTPVTQTVGVTPACRVCHEPIDPAAGTVHPTCETETAA